MERFKAKITVEGLCVVDKKGNVITQIASNEVLSVIGSLSGVYEVMAGGWLRPPLIKGEDELGLNVVKMMRSTTRHLRRAVSGKKVGYHDNSFFFRVSDELRWKMVLLLQFGFIGDVARAIDSGGKPVPVEACRPLKYPDLET